MSNMTPEQFTYWLQGFAEINVATPTDEQWKAIKEHLKTVFVKVTPPYNPIPMPDRSMPLREQPFGPAICSADTSSQTYC